MLSIEASYFIFASAAIVGVLQVMAARYRLIGLSLIRDVRKPLLGYLLGAVLIIGAFLWFFSTQEEIFIPGPAGAELTSLFAAALVCALASTLFLSALMHRPRKPSTSPLEGQPRFHCEGVSFGRGQGVLYIPTDQTMPWAAVCVLPGPEGGCDSLGEIAATLAESGFVVLAVDMSVNRYPEVLALLPAAVSYLSTRGGVDPQRIGAMGADLGADLAIRAVGSDKRIKAVIALAPLLEEASATPGLRLLGEMTYPQARCWSRFLDGGKLLAKLETASYARKLSPRPLLIVYGEDDGLIPLERVRKALGDAGELRLVKGEGHINLPSSAVAAPIVSKWFRESL